MFARSTTLTTPAEGLDDTIALVRDEAMPQITSVDGCLGMSMLVDRETGQCIATTAWEDEESMRASAGAMTELRERAAADVGGQVTSVQEWEVEVVHRNHHVGQGACCRATWLRTEPVDLDRAVEVFRDGVLPQAEGFQGFCSASLLVDRNAGLAVATVTFDTRADVEATRERAATIRSDVAQEIGLEYLDVREYEVAIAHLHVPELV